MSNSLDFYFDHFGSKLPVVTRKGSRMNGVFKPANMTPIYTGYCEVTMNPTAEVVTVNRGYEGTITVDWRLLSTFASYPRTGGKPSRLRKGVIALITPTTSYVTLDLANTPLRCGIPKVDLFKMVVKGEVKPPFMLLFFSDNTTNVIGNLRLTYADRLVDLAGARNGIVHLDGIRALQTKGIKKSQVSKTKRLVLKGEADPADPVTQALVSWSDLEYEFFNVTA